MSSNFVHPSAKVDPAARICENTIIRAGCLIGPEVQTSINVNIGARTQLSGKVKIGACVQIGRDVTVIGPLEIQDDVVIGNNVTIGTQVAQDSLLECAILSKGAHINDDAFLLGKLSIGEYAQIKAGAHLEGDVPHHGLANGRPAALENFVCSCGHLYNGHLVKSGLYLCDCPACGEQYRVRGTDLARRGKFLLPNQQPGCTVPAWQDE